MFASRFSRGVSAALCLAAAPAAAQEVSCGGLGDGAAWIGGLALTSDIVASPDPLFLGAAQAAAGARFVTLFSVASPGEYRIEARPTDGVGDPLLELFDEAGALVVIDDDSGGGLASRAELPLQPGRYCLALSGFGGDSVAADLQVSRLDQAAITVGLAGGFAGTEDLPPFVGVQPCLPTTRATPLGTGAIDTQLSLGAVATNSASAAPYYRFSIDSPQTISVRAENPEADPYIYLFDGAGNLLDENDDAGNSLNSRLDFTRALQPGTYCIGMRALSDPDLPITLSVRAYDAAAAAAEQYAYADAMPPLGGAYPVADLGVLPSLSVRDLRVPSDRAQFLSFEIDTPGLILITADEVIDSDPWLRVFDGVGTMIAENDDANGTLNSEVAVRVRPGRYTVAVRQYSTASNGTVRLALQRYVPAP